ncbi:1-acyl-sn-glycerol-3-phosphate acyltransferase [Flavobacterium sp.]|uniref:1-acyl-sn-glycerol-3-phosphate acyltransferase n=1 Tax=Flavobacterium sp. TaxID=239 RepID=UPI00286C1938|nr:1-acyl-sn-glycerol-3-phosphate acyltransferase [Flavobacterium sp.]
MKQLWLFSVRTYIRAGLFFYFKEIKTINAHNIPINKPVLLLPNHQNALLDALLIATQTKRPAYFLTRAGAFNNPIAASILKSLNMLPVYRIRDGWKTVSKNNSVFKTCSELLLQNKCVVIFPEGSHNINRTVRNLSKGFTRLVFDTIATNKECDLQLVPIGFNYIKPEDAMDSVAIYVGKPLQAKDYSQGERHTMTLALKNDMQKQLSILTTHIDSDFYQETINKLDTLGVDYLNPIVVNECINSGFTICEKEPKKKLILLKKGLKSAMIFTLFPPYLIWKFLVEPKIEDIEFRATFRFAIGITLVPLWLLVLFIIVTFIINIQVASLLIISSLLISLLAVKL